MLLDREGPAAFRGRETTARVLVAAGPYRLSGEWWREGGERDDGLFSASTGTCTRPTAPSTACTRIGATAAGTSMGTTTSRSAPLMSDYVELRCRSAFSFLDGASLPEDLVAAAAAGDHDALALADRDGVYGAPRFFAAARKTGLRPIVGAEISLAAGAAPRAAAGRGSPRLPEPLPADHGRQSDRASRSPIRSTRRAICWRRTRAG